MSLKEGHRPTADYVRELRRALAEEDPGITFSFLPADIVGQILNFGLPSPIDIQVRGNKFAENKAYALDLYNKLSKIPGIADARIQQASDYPEFHVNIDRSRAEDVGLSQLDVASNMLISLSGSFQTSPAFWLNPKNGVSYSVITQAPQYKLDSLEALRNIPVGAGKGGSEVILGSLADIHRDVGNAVVSHYNVQPTIDIFASVQGRDLGGVSADIHKLLADTAKDAPKGTTVEARGQMQTQKNAFNGLYGGLAFSILLVYLLIVVNFQSWLDPFIIIMALPRRWRASRGCCSSRTRP